MDEASRFSAKDDPTHAADDRVIRTALPMCKTILRPGKSYLRMIDVSELSQHRVTRAPDRFSWTHRAPIFEHSSHCLAFGLTVLMAVGH